VAVAAHVAEFWGQGDTFISEGGGGDRGGP
jgi:hypothetical protein